MIFKKYENVIICPIPENSELDRTQIERIVTHTHNTWQHDRPVAEIRANTIQGKKAEIVIEKLLAENSAARYLSYDKLRNDNFEMHAPFDGLIYNCSTGKNRLNEVVRTINNDVKNSVGDTGMLKPETREFLEDNGFYTIEIKSSLLQNPRDYRNMTHKNRTDRTREDYICLCDHIKEFYDFFVYPHYCRDNINICSFYDYTVYVRGKNPEFRNCSIENFIIKLMRDEYRNACNIYTRVFFDPLSDEIIIPGYVVKNRFFEEPRIQKMPSPKSRNAIYYMYHMKYGTSFLEIDSDRELRKWDRISSYAKLFGKKETCRNCGAELKFRETTKGTNDNHKFLYLCDECSPKRWFQMNELHNNNMNVR